MRLLGQVRQGAYGLGSCDDKKVCSDSMLGCAVANAASFDLPDDVFQPGEIKPARPEKKKKPNGKKRVATDV